MCQNHSESGKPCGFTPCEEYALLKSERDRLQGVVQGMTEQAERNAKDLHWHNQRLIEVTKERDASLHKVEYSERCHKKMVAHVKSILRERDALLKVRDAADALAKDIMTNCEDCCERCEECVFATAAMKAKVYQEARHG